MNYIKNGIFNVFLYGCGLFVVNGLSFCMLPFYTRQFSPQEYALVTLILTVLPFTRYCLPLEICQAVPVFLADDLEKASHYISIGFWFTVLMNIGCYAVFFFLNLHYDFVMLSSFQLFIIFLLLSMDCLFYYTSNLLRWQLKPILYNSIISLVAMMEVLLILLFVIFYKLAIFGVFYAWLLSRGLGFLVTLFCTKQNYFLIFSLKTLKNMLSFSLPLVISNIPYHLNRYIDRWMIINFLGLYAVGIYGAGSTIGGPISFITASITSALAPIIYRAHQRKEAPVDIVKLFYIVVTLCMFVAILFSIFNNDILHLLLSDEYHQRLIEQPIVPIIVLTSIVSGLGIFSPGIAIKKKNHFVVWFNLCALTVNFILALLLINKFGIFGVTLATFASVLLNTFMYMRKGQKYYHLPFVKMDLIKFLSIFLIFYIASIFLGFQVQTTTLSNFIFRLLYCITLLAFIGNFIWSIFKKLDRKMETNQLLQYIAPSSAGGI